MNNDNVVSESSTAADSPDFARHREVLEREIEKTLQAPGDLPMYHMLRYFMGYQNCLRAPLVRSAGKRVRPLLLLAAADMCGGAPAAMDLAVGVELFHNFSLIHDDIEDRDEMRRGQPTVWKLWGINHGINSGDMQLVLAHKCLLAAGEVGGAHGMRAARVVQAAFQMVAEGQYLDLELSGKRLDDVLVSRTTYLTMIRKKTAALLSASAEAGGVAAGCGHEEQQHLALFGMSLGCAYQLLDDAASLWGESTDTGKKVYGDVYEKKKTYPILWAVEQGLGEQIQELFDQESVREATARDVVALLEKTNAREVTLEEAGRYRERATQALEQLSGLGRATEELQRLLARLCGAH